MLPYLTYIIPTLAVAAVLALGYAKVKQIGYEEAEQKYVQLIEQYNKDVSSKIDRIESLSISLQEASKLSNQALNRNLDKVSSEIKGKPLVYIAEGECLPNKTFANSFNKYNSEVNKAIKESKK